MSPREIRITVAAGPCAWFLETLGISAITMPWKRIYVLERHSPRYGCTETTATGISACGAAQ